MRKISIKCNICFIILCYAVILFFSYSNNEKVFKESEFPNAIQQNEIEAKSCQKLFYDNCERSPILDKYLTVRPKSEQPERYCTYKLNPDANKTIMITGNSFAYFQNRGILEAIKESKTQFKEAFFITHPGCSIIAGKFNLIKPLTCENYDGSFDILLNATKPDIIIHSSRLDHFINKKVPVLNFSEADIYYNEFKRATLNIAQFTRRFIIVEPNPIIWSKTYKSPFTVAQTLLSNGSISSFNISIEKHHITHDPTWNRIKRIAENCPNCILVPTEHLFCQEKFCSSVDLNTKLGMYCDLSHLTPRSSLRLKPCIIKAIDSKNA